MSRMSLAEKRRRDLWILIFMGVSVIAAIGGGTWYYFTRPAQADKLTLCPAKGPLGQVVVLVDNTDPYNFIQRQAFAEGLKALTDRVVPEGHLLTVYALGQDFTQNAEPIFEKCNPGSAKGMSTFDSNPKRVQARYEREFKGPVTQLENVLMKDKASDKSPIFEMIQLVAINSFRADNIQGPKTLILYSDMLANTPEFSMFSGVPDFDAFAASAYGQRSQTKMEGVEVRVNYLIKYPKLQNLKQLNFWERYFEKAGAHMTEVTPVEG